MKRILSSRLALALLAGGALFPILAGAVGSGDPAGNLALAVTNPAAWRILALSRRARA